MTRKIDFPGWMSQAIQLEADRLGLSFAQAVRVIVDRHVYGPNSAPTRPEQGPNSGHTGAEVGPNSDPAPLFSPPEVSPQTPFPTPLLSHPPIVPPRISSRAGEFDRFWESYPRRVGKAAAKRTWLRKAAEISAFGIDPLLAKLEVLKASEQWRRDGGSYVPHPATWLNRGGWEDEPENGGAVAQRQQTGAVSPRPGSIAVTKLAAERWLWDELRAGRIDEETLTTRSKALEACTFEASIAELRKVWEGR